MDENVTTFTPGPWDFEEENDEGEPYKIAVSPSYQACVGAANDSVVADIRLADFGDSRTREEARANARLIAAAPDLYAACRAWDQGFVDGEDFTPEQFLAWVNENRRIARAALAKAVQP